MFKWFIWQWVLVSYSLTLTYRLLINKKNIDWFIWFISNSDVIGVVKTVSEPQKIMTKKQEELTKREIQLVDELNKAVSLTLWGEKVGNFGVKFNKTCFIHPVNPKLCKLDAVSHWSGSGRDLFHFSFYSHLLIRSLFQAEKFEVYPEVPNPVIAFKGCGVREFQGGWYFVQIHHFTESVFRFVMYNKVFYWLRNQPIGCLLYVKLLMIRSHIPHYSNK